MTASTSNPLNALARRKQALDNQALPVRPIAPDTAPRPSKDRLPIRPRTFVPPVHTTPVNTPEPSTLPVHTMEAPSTTPEVAPAPVVKPKPRAKRKRMPVLTEREFVALTFLGMARMALPEQVVIAMSAFQNADPRTGEIKAASLGKVKNILTKLRKMGLVDYVPTVRGITVWVLTPVGEQAVDSGFKSKPIRFSHWEHTLGLSYLIAHAVSEGLTVITDLQMQAATSMRIQEGKSSTVSAADLKAEPDYGNPAMADLWHEYFAFQTDSGKSHRADLIILSENHAPEAYELELSYKRSTEVQEILGGYLRAVADGRFSKVVYAGRPALITYVRKQLHEIISTSHPLYDRFEFLPYDAKEWFSETPAIAG